MTAENKRDQFLNVSQIAAAYPISISTIWAELKRGKFPDPVMIGRKKVWRREDIAAYFTPRASRAA
ncbi:helix-turn-helix transcriptional regulator [Bosea massiliensis]|uniref:Helix-turn-helix transcriptional regulator n=1 Tax=Bosea massiliensis TaxID=151419 RepID=A0ABW0P9I8_9HYPH